MLKYFPFTLFIIILLTVGCGVAVPLEHSADEIGAVSDSSPQNAVVSRFLREDDLINSWANMSTDDKRIVWTAFAHDLPFPGDGTLLSNVVHSNVQSVIPSEPAWYVEGVKVAAGGGGGQRTGYSLPVNVYNRVEVEAGTRINPSSFGEAEPLAVYNIDHEIDPADWFPIPEGSSLTVINVTVYDTTMSEQHPTLYQFNRLLTFAFATPVTEE